VRLGFERLRQITAPVRAERRAAPFPLPPGEGRVRGTRTGQAPPRGPSPFPLPPGEGRVRGTRTGHAPPRGPSPFPLPEGEGRGRGRRRRARERGRSWLRLARSCPERLRMPHNATSRFRDPARSGSVLPRFHAVARGRLAIRRDPAQCCADSTVSRAAVWRFDAIRLRVIKSPQSRWPSTPGGAPRSGQTPTAPPVAPPRPDCPPSGCHVPSTSLGPCLDAPASLLLAWAGQSAHVLVVTRLPPFACSMWRPPTGASRDERRRALVRRFGGPPDGASRTAPRERGRQESSCGRLGLLPVVYHTLPGFVKRLTIFFFRAT
jgi:hypothetical protein